MLYNYLKIAWRQILRNKVYTAINLLGLAIGIACAVLIGLYIFDEISYDRFHTKADRIVRIVENQKDQEGKVTQMATTYGALAPIIQAEFPSWPKVTRLFPFDPLVSYQTEKQFQEDAFFYVDSTFLEIFSFLLLEGEASTVLDAPFSLLLTASTAHKYFGEEDPIGKVLTIRDDNGAYDFKIKGILEDVPLNSHIKFDFLASYSSLQTIMPWVNNWHYPPLYTYALMGEQEDMAQINRQLAAFPSKHLRPDLAQSRSFHIQPLNDIHLYSQRENEVSANGDIIYVYVFAAIAFFILLIACINFMNLATARSIKRAKEVGMRKVMGAYRSQLIRQFLSESVLMVSLAMILAIGIIELVLPSFNALAAKQLDIAYFSHWQIPALGLMIIAIIGLLAGSYPAFYLSSFIPARVLKGMAWNSRAGAASWLRKTLVTFQFAVSCLLIVGTAVIYSQLDYIHNKKLGFEKEQLVVIPLRDQKDQVNAENLRIQLLQHANILSATASSGLPAKDGFYGFPVTPKQARMDSVTMLVNFINDHDYLSTLKMELLDGRDFSKDFSTDAMQAFIINEAAAKKLGWEKKAVGQELTLNYHYQGPVKKEGKVIGVVKDFHFNSLYKEIDPLILHISGGTYYNNNLVARIAGGDISETLAFMDEKWRGFNGIRPFEYSFMDETFDALYRKEENLGKVAGLFSVLAIFIACLGLFGLAAFTTEQRTKEIGIRKVMGASIPSIIALLSVDFLKLVMLAFIMSIPLGYLFMNNWLESFAYRIDLGAEVFIFAGIVALTIAFLTVSTQAYKAALTNPAETLRNN